MFEMAFRRIFRCMQERLRQRQGRTELDARLVATARRKAADVGAERRRDH